MSDRRWTLAAVALALLWAVGPALPALASGGLLGHGLTDLYPSVWGLWAFAEAQPSLPGDTTLLGFPDGMGWYFPSPIKGWLAGPLLTVLGLPATFNLLTIMARFATVLCAFFAARAWGLGGAGALTAAGVFGCAPFFHGFAVEGIIEGTDGWTLALWAWAAGKRRTVLAAGALGLAVISSWYLGLSVCLLAVLAAVRDRRAPLALGGLLLAAPFILQFMGAFPANAPLDETVRVAMGAWPTIPQPGALPGLQPFAMNAYVGWIALGLALYSRSPALALALIPAALSTGWGPWYDLPILEMIRFPYRWHAATLALVALAAGAGADRWPRAGGIAGLLIAVEGLLLSPVEPIIPSANADQPAILSQVQGPILDIPGPVAMPPGVENPSRRRAAYWLYGQTSHGQPSPWVSDFNAVGVAPTEASLTSPFLPWDRVLRPQPPPPPLAPGTVDALREAGVRHALLHRSELGSDRLSALRDQLVDQGATLTAEDGERWLMTVPAR
jgi:hypothetical protein